MEIGRGEKQREEMRFYGTAVGIKMQSKVLYKVGPDSDGSFSNPIRGLELGNAELVYLSIYLFIYLLTGKFQRAIHLHIGIEFLSIGYANSCLNKIFRYP